MGSVLGVHLFKLKLMLTQSKLIELYTEHKLTIYEIAEQYNIGKSTIYRWLKKYNIPVRGYSERRWRRGPLTEEWRENISKSVKQGFINGRVAFNKGRHPSAEARKKMKAPRPSIQGANNPNWKGGKTSKSTAFLNSSAWADCRNEVFQRDNWTCQLSSIRGGDLECHHIIPRYLIPESLWLDQGNLITLSKKIHNMTKGIELDFIEICFQKLLSLGYVIQTNQYCYYINNEEFTYTS